MEKSKVSKDFRRALTILAFSGLAGLLTLIPKTSRGRIDNKEYMETNRYEEYFKRQEKIFKDLSNSLEKVDSYKLQRQIYGTTPNMALPRNIRFDIEKKGLEKVLKNEDKVGEHVFKRFKEFEDYFEEYSQNPPENMSRGEFMALLVAVAQKESSIGYPNGRRRNENLLMGYGNPRNKNLYGAERQIRLASETLRKALNGENKHYMNALKKDGDEKLKYILSIYNQGRINSKGLRYANQVLEFYNKWKSEIGE